MDFRQTIKQALIVLSLGIKYSMRDLICDFKFSKMLNFLWSSSFLFFQFFDIIIYAYFSSNTQLEAQ